MNTLRFVSVAFLMFLLVPAFYGWSQTYNGYNYQKAEIPTQPVLNDNDLDAANLNSKMSAYQYLDGLGRPVQSVIVRGSFNSRDLIGETGYDNTGRACLKYLPYSIEQSNTGLFRSDWLNEQKQYYSTTVNGAYNNGVKTDTKPYSKVTYFLHPLNRVAEVSPPGASWRSRYYRYSINANGVGSVGAGAVDYDYVERWDVVGDIPVQNGYWERRCLYVRFVIDEQSRYTKEFRDMNGRLVIRKTQIADVVEPDGDAHWSFTYFVYDDLNRLRFVLQPEFHDKMAAYNAGTDAVKRDYLKKYAYQYHYNEKGQLGQKQLPGSDYVSYLYDRWDRLRVTQDGLQRLNNKWTYYKYDAKNRIIMEGEMSSTETVDWMGERLIDEWDKTYEAPATNANGYTTTNMFPSSSSYPSTTTVNSILYYDNYNFITALNLGTGYNYSPSSGFQNACVTCVREKMTGSKVRIMGTSTWLVAARYYDDRYRLVHTVYDDHRGNKNKESLAYYGTTDWITKMQTEHGTALTIVNDYAYDHMGRLLRAYQTTGNTPRIMLASMRYNEVGQMIEKNVHSADDGVSFLQSVDHRYNIRGFLTHINQSDLSNDGVINNDADDLFGMQLRYESALTVAGTSSQPRYNGDVSSAAWKSVNPDGTAQEKAVTYTYDPTGRLTSTQYGVKAGTTYTADQNMYNETFAYDKNGNITAMSRNSTFNGTQAKIDQLAYTYAGNQVTNIHDNSAYWDKSGNNPDYGYSEITHSTTTEYGYDQNGNMTWDTNKGVIDITYNSFNLPEIVTLDNNRTITYTYDGTGRKLKKVTKVGATVISETDYIGNICYENGQLAYIMTSEGRVIKNGTSWDYEYHHRDHLGNTRVVYGYGKQTDNYKATMENALAPDEEAKFKNIQATRMLGNNHTRPGYRISAPDQSAETNGMLPGKAIGPAKMLQVSAGDNVNLEVQARYNTGIGSNTALVATLATAVTATFGITGAGDPTAYSALMDRVPVVSGSITRRTGVPKAYLIYILFDNNHVYKQFGYHAVSATAINGHEKLSLQVAIPSNGFLYTYVANESNVSAATSVYFDDFSIIHQRSSLGLQVTQVQDYYAFGLGINPLSYQREGVADNDYLYNGKELQDDHDLNWLDYGARMYMADIGRWGVTDPLADLMPEFSGYSYVFNNPINYSDPTGMMPCQSCDGVVDISGGAFSEGPGGGRSKGGETSTATGLSLDWMKGSGSSGASGSGEDVADIGGGPGMEDTSVGVNDPFGNVNSSRPGFGFGDVVKPESFYPVRVTSIYIINVSYDEVMWTSNVVNIVKRKKSSVHLRFTNIQVSIPAIDPLSKRFISRETAQKEFAFLFNMIRGWIWNDLDAGKITSNIQAQEKFIQYMNGPLTPTFTHMAKGVPQTSIYLTPFMIWPSRN